MPPLRMSYVLSFATAFIHLAVIGYGHYISDLRPGTVETPWVSPLFLVVPAGKDIIVPSHQQRNALQGAVGGAEQVCEPD